MTTLGFAQIATCASCHGAHEVLPADNPLSKVSAQNRLATCQECHPKANVNFVSFDPHANKHERESGLLLYFTGKFMELLLLGVFAFFGLHTVLWFFRSLKAMRRSAARPVREGEALMATPASTLPAQRRPHAAGKYYQRFDRSTA